MYGKIAVTGYLAAAAIMIWTVSAVAGSEHQHQGHQQKEEAVKEEGVKITGQVVDITCYTRKGLHGSDHLKCAEYCANLGMLMGILDSKSGEIYTIFPVGHGEPNAKVMPYLEKKVRITGTVFRKAGIQAIEIQEIDAAKG